LQGGPLANTLQDFTGYHEMIVQRRHRTRSERMQVMRITLAHLSDPHLPPLPVPRLRDLAGSRARLSDWPATAEKSTSATCSSLVSTCRRHKPDHIAITGDLSISRSKLSCAVAGMAGKRRRTGVSR